MSAPLAGDAAPRGSWKRFVVFAIIIALVVLALGARLFALQVANGGYYAGLSRENRLTLQPVTSARGLIFDRDGRRLVENVPTFSIKVRAADLPLSQRQPVVERLSVLLEMSPVEIIEAIDRAANNRFELVRIAKNVPEDVARIVSEEHLSMPGVEVAVEPQRRYSYTPLVSQVMGYTGAVTPEDLERLGSAGYLNDDTIGKAGVEASFEEILRGEYGIEEVERDARGEVVRVRRTVQEPVAGDSLELTIDVDVQSDAETALRWAMDVAGLQRGVVIVMDPQTGEILAMVSLPTYDSNAFAQGISNAEYRALLEAPGGPLKNYAISENFPPGSTFKLITGTGALQDGEITDQTLIRTAPYISIGNYRYWDWNRRGFGPLDIYDGFGHSSDTFFYQVAGMLGIDRLAYWANQFGLGQRTGIDLPGEVAGIMPSNEWKQRVLNQPIYPGEVYHAGIGQGYDSFTPIQMLNAYSALANGGTLYKPQIVRRVLAPDGSVVREMEPEVIRELPIDPQVLETMRQASRRVLTLYHTWNLVDLPIVVAGKTGTAEYGVRDAKGRLPFHSWFAAFVPREPRKDPADPDGMEAVSRTDAELAVLAFAYDSNTTGNAATEIVKYFLQLHYDLRVDLRDDDLLVIDNLYGQ